MLFDVELTIPPIKVDEKGFTNAMKKAMIKLFREAVGEFTKSIVELDLIGIDTGMSAASLHDAAVAARVWGDVSATIKFKRKNTRRKGLTEMDGSYDASAYRSMKAGVARARDATKVVLKWPRLEFNFGINVYQWFYWEVQRNKWQALDVAAQVFLDYIDDNIEGRVPNFFEFVG